METLPYDLYKEIFGYLSNYELLRLVNKLYRKIFDEMKINDGIIVSIRPHIVKQFIETYPDKIGWMSIEKFGEYFGVIYKKMSPHEEMNTLYKFYRLNMLMIQEMTYEDKLMDLYEQFDNVYDNFYPHEKYDTQIFPLKELIIYNIKTHHLSDNEVFVKNSLLKTINYYIEGINKNYPSKREYVDFYLKLLDLSNDNIN